MTIPKAPAHRILFVIYLLFTLALISGGIQIFWFGNRFYDDFITLMLIWLIYPFLAFALEQKHSNKTIHHRARRILKEHVAHLSDEELRRSLRHEKH